MPETKCIETNEIIAQLLDNGIIHVFIKPNTEVTVEVQEKMVEAYWQLTSIKRPFIFEAGPFISMTKEARKNAKVIEGKAPIICTAMIIKNLAQRLIADFYFHLNIKVHPTKIFKQKEDAIKWCLEQAQNYNKATETNS